MQPSATCNVYISNALSNKSNTGQGIGGPGSELLLQTHPGNYLQLNYWQSYRRRRNQYFHKGTISRRDVHCAELGPNNGTGYCTAQLCAQASIREQIHVKLGPNSEMATAAQDNYPQADPPPKGDDEPSCVRELRLWPTYSEHRRDDRQPSLTTCYDDKSQPWFVATNRQRRRALNYMAPSTAYDPPNVATKCRTTHQGATSTKTGQRCNHSTELTGQWGITTYPTLATAIYRN